MLIQRVSIAMRRKVLVQSYPMAGKVPTFFIRWSHPDNAYTGVMEMANGSTGERFQIVATQLEWEEFHSKIMERFAKDATA